MMQFKDILLRNKELYASDIIRVNIADLLYKIQKYFEGFNVYTSAQFNTELMRNPVSMKNVDLHLNNSATNFINVFNNYKAKDIRWKTDFEEHLI